MSKIKQLVRIADEKAHALVSPMRTNSDAEALKAYRRTVFEWKHTYVSWIEANENYSGNSDDTLEAFLKSNGEWVVFCTKNGCFSKGAAGYFSEALSVASCDVSVIYGDEDYVWGQRPEAFRMCPFFKPDYSPETLLSFSYFGELIFLRKTIADRLADIIGQDGHREKSTLTEAFLKGLSTINYVDATTLYELSLYATEMVRENEVYHIGCVMFHRFAESLCNISEADRQLAQDVAYGSDEFYSLYDRLEARLSDYLEADANISKVLAGCGEDCLVIREAALTRRRIKAELIKDKELDLYRICADTQGKKVSMVILSKDNPVLLEKCIAGVRRNTDYPEYEIVVVDNGSNPDNKKRCEEISEKYAFSYYHHPMEFNFSALCNYGVEKSEGELILLMNDDVEVIDSDYMKLMAGLACREEIGAVGARLRYGDGISLQHVGVTSLGIGPSHQLQKKSDDRNRYFGRNRVDYEMLAVTAACLMVRREVYEQVKGLDEGLKVAYNDVDFCMKIVEAGYRNVQCNGAILLHHESLSRGFDGDSDEKWYRLLAEKDGLYSRHPQYKKTDPYHSSNLIDNSSEYVCSYKTYAQDLSYRSESERVAGNSVADNDIDCDNTAGNNIDDNNKAGNNIDDGNTADITSVGTKSFGFRLTMDHCLLQRRFNPDDEDFWWIDGWVYVPGADHTFFGKKVMLKNKENGDIYRIHCCDVYRCDVEALLPAAKNIAMSGFLARISPSAIPEGSYIVGLELNSGDKLSCIWTERAIDNLVKE